MKTINYLEKFTQRVMNEINTPYPRPIDMTAEEKETYARLNGCAIMWKGNKLYALCVDAFSLGVPKGEKWRLIHRENSVTQWI